VRGWLLDTNVISALVGPKPEPHLKAWLAAQPEHKLHLSILTFAEYRKGIENLPPAHKLRQTIQHTVLALEARFAGRILSVSDETVLRWGSISGEVKRLTGHSPSVIDTMLAATAIEHKLYLATRNTIHVAHSGAAIFNPWKDNPLLYKLL
jgi:predicted nucleic acid-binding protein